MSADDDRAPDDEADDGPERPPPSRSYAPESLAPFRPIQAPDLPDAGASGPRPHVLAGFVLALALVAFLLGGLFVAVMAR
ncbi:MAG: hypothetical protein H6737_00235 [Alphaproteobacteria bacterium]|nr:hypothetical protein [Alphaproteobacteria bacterium]